MMVKHLRPVKLDKSGWRSDDKARQFYGDGPPVWEFDIYFVKSRHYYDTDFVRARDNRQAKRTIKRRYPWIQVFDFGEEYAA